jgi:DNA polymerase III subunit epsilon
MAYFQDGVLAQEWKTYVDPEDYFDAINVSIHGIDADTVLGAPKFPDVASRICDLIDGRIAVCHTHFDRASIRKACVKHSLPEPVCTWLDSARVARRAWAQFARNGYGLANVCGFLGYTYGEHDALEDAKAAAHVLQCAIAQTGVDLQGWLKRVDGPIKRPTGSVRAAKDERPDAPFQGEVLVFTGTLRIARSEASDIALRIGCTVADGVNRKTTILVVGDQDIRNLAGHEKSSKHRKAEELIRSGQALRILQESDFMDLVSSMTSQGTH